MSFTMKDIKAMSSENNETTPTPWKVGLLDRPWNDFVLACNDLSKDQIENTPCCIIAEDGTIVALFGPGPKAINNAEKIVNAINAQSNVSFEFCGRERMERVMQERFFKNIQTMNPYDAKRIKEYCAAISDDINKNPGEYIKVVE